MGAINLPPEILHKIFSNLYGHILIRCRAVCKSWKAAVDSLGDTQWEQVCANSLNSTIYKEIHAKSGISWCAIFKAVNSWAHVKTAKIECHVLPDNAQRYKVLPDRSIAVLSNSKCNAPSEKGLSDTIIYYNIDTFEEIKRSQYDKPFREYDENEDLIVLLSKDGELTLVQKANNQQKVVGKVMKQNGSMSGFGLFGKKVYFQNKDSLICISKLKQTKKGEMIIRTAPLRAFDENYDSFNFVLAYGQMDGKLTILDDEGHVSIYENEDFGMLSKIRYHSMDILGEMLEFGFNWNAPRLHQWLFGMYGNTICLSKIKQSCFLLHGKVGLLGESKKNYVHFFYFPFKEYGQLNVLYKFSCQQMKPTRSIDLNQFVKLTKGSNSVDQVEVIESVDHHLVIALSGHKVFLLKVMFNVTEEAESDDDDDEEMSRPLAKRIASKTIQPKSNAKKIAIKPKRKLRKP